MLVSLVVVLVLTALARVPMTAARRMVIAHGRAVWVAAVDVLVLSVCVHVLVLLDVQISQVEIEFALEIARIGGLHF